MSLTSTTIMQTMHRNLQKLPHRAGLKCQAHGGVLVFGRDHVEGELVTLLFKSLLMFYEVYVHVVKIHRFSRLVFPHVLMWILSFVELFVECFFLCGLGTTCAYCLNVLSGESFNQ